MCSIVRLRLGVTRIEMWLPSKAVFTLFCVQMSATVTTRTWPPSLQWVENNLTSIHIFCTDIHFLPHGTTLTALLRISVYRCSRTLDGLVSSHPLLCRGKVGPLCGPLTISPTEAEDKICSGCTHESWSCLPNVVSVQRMLFSQGLNPVNELVT